MALFKIILHLYFRKDLISRIHVMISHTLNLIAKLSYFLICLRIKQVFVGYFNHSDFVYFYGTYDIVLYNCCQQCVLNEIFVIG